MDNKLVDLVFEGGGAKGSAFVGALKRLYEDGYTPRRIVGTSAGAITATLLGAGYSPDEMLDAVNETTIINGQPAPRFATFMDAPIASDFSSEVVANSDCLALLSEAVGRLPLVGHALAAEILKELLNIDKFRELFGFEECGGFYAGSAFLNWFREKLQKKNLSPTITWSQFATTTKQDVSVVTSDTSAQEMVVLNARTAPDAPVAESVRMSMSIPFIWREMVWQKQWGTYLGSDLTNHIFVDGGVLSNFPIRLVEVKDDITDAVMGKDFIPQGAGTIGLLLDETQPVSGAAAIQTTPPRVKTIGRAMRVIDTMMGTNDAEAIRKYADRICKIPVGGYGTTEFRMPKEKLDKLVDSGRQAMDTFLVTHDANVLKAKVAAMPIPKAG